MKKRISILAVVLGLALSTMALPAFAAGKSAPKATGDIGYSAYGLQRYASFNAITTSTACTQGWDVTGSWLLDFNLTGDATIYTHDAALAQAGNVVTGSGGFPAGGPYIYAWNVTVGSLSGNAINFTIDYTLGAVGTTMQMTGAVAPDGSMSGTWSDNFGGARTGDWVSSAGAAVRTHAGCTAKGTFNYSDVNGSWYTVDVRFAQVVGDQAWFAGPVVAGNVGAGNWLFVQVKDGGEPGIGFDKVWGSFTSQAAAINGVAAMATPGDGPFTISSGNLQVH